MTLICKEVPTSPSHSFATWEDINHKYSDKAAVRAQINGYRVGGKTGTAQIAAANYSRDAHNAIFVGIAPISEPRIVVAVIVNEPQGREYYGGQVAAPIFASIASRTLRLLGVSPDKI
jgi:cell division protein FtsI (penicillin-binding protein 3)